MFENGGTHADLTDRFEVFGADTAMVDTLHRIVSWAADAIESTAFASITLTIDGETWSVVSTDVEALEVERSQYDAHDGPSLDAFRTGRICRIPSTFSDGPWPVFRQACRARGVLSAASFPLACDGAVYGAMTLYSYDYHAFGTHETRLGRSFADQAVTAILDARSSGLAREPSDEALENRGTRDIDRAQQIIMVSTGVTADTAMAMLIAQADEQDRTLEDVATDLVNSKVVPLSAFDTA
jgi:hypothetical protein